MRAVAVLCCCAVAVAVAVCTVLSGAVRCYAALCVSGLSECTCACACVCAYPADACHLYSNSDAEFASSIRHLSNRSIRGIFFSGSMLHFLVSSASENTTMKTDYVACCKLLLAQAGGKAKGVHTSAFHHRVL